MIRRKKTAVFCFLLSILSLNLAHAGEVNGSLTGEIRLVGERPEGGAPAVVEYQGPCGIKRPTSIVRLWKDRVMDVKLWLTKEGESQIPDQVIITSWRCEYNPKMVPAVPGTLVLVENEDPETQWVIIEKNGLKTDQVLQESGDKPLEIVAEAGQEIHLLSGFYPWMDAWIKPVADLVAKTATDWDGRFFFKDIQPGTYTLYFWHPSFGENSQVVTIIANEKTSVELQLEIPENPPIIIEATMLEKIFGIEEEKYENVFKK